jgi:hypothetical protein
MASKEKNLSILEKARGFKNAPWCEEYEKMISGMLYCPHPLPTDTGTKWIGI